MFCGCWTLTFYCLKMGRYDAPNIWQQNNNSWPTSFKSTWYVTCLSQKVWEVSLSIKLLCWTHLYHRTIIWSKMSCMDSVNRNLPAGRSHDSENQKTLWSQHTSNYVSLWPWILIALNHMVVWPLFTANYGNLRSGKTCGQLMSGIRWSF